MMTSLRKIIFLSVILFMSFSLNLSAQQSTEFREKVEKIKKEKLIEFLQLSGDRANKFLELYSKNIETVKSKNKALAETTKELHKAIKKNESKSSLEDKTNRTLQAQSDYFRAIEESIKSMRGVLNETEFAKYVVFEKSFNKALRKKIQDKFKENNKK